MRTAAILLLALFALPALADDAWHQGLYLGNAGYWRQRIQITVRNEMDRPAAGDPVAVKVGAAAGEAALAGAPADALRICDAKGTEVLWGLVGPGGERVIRGPIPAGASLVLPAEADARASATYYAYFDNPAAWRVPDFLDGGFGLRNGGLEQGAGAAPDAWKHDANDTQHRTAWLDETPHGGKKCLKTVVADGAEETWIATRQSGIRIVGGAKYVMRAWVKAQGVKGTAGWYIHVGNPSNTMLISPMPTGGAGTYDWKEVTAEFTAPKEASIADLGTVLRGTGTAWFDDISLECAEKPRLSAEAGKPERLQVAEEGADAPWLAGTATGRSPWTYRVPVFLMNVTGERRGGALVAVDLAPIMSRARLLGGTPDVQVVFGGKAVRHYRLKDVLLFEEDVPAHTRRAFYVYLRAGAGAGSGRVVAASANAAAPVNPALPQAADNALKLVAGPDYEALLNSPRNLVKNPSFEQGEALPADWPGGAEGERPADTRMGLDTPGLFGKRCAVVEIPKTSKKAWTGWRQDVPVKPGRSYLYATCLKCRDLSGGLQLHAHLRTPAGELCKQNAMTGVGPAISDTTGWSLLAGVFNTPEDCGIFQVHLTMLATGTAWHDGAVLVEVAPGTAGRLESRAGGSGTGLAVWPVNAVVKVFQEDLPPRQPAPARRAAAPGEKAPRQLGVRSAQAVSGVQVVVDAPALGGKALPVEVGVVGYVPIDHTTSYYSVTTPAWQRKFPTTPGACDGWPGLWPDPLLPKSTFDLAAGRTQPVWLTVSVPKDAAPGEYRGKARLMAQGKTLATVPFSVRVWDFAVPEQGHVAAIYDMRMSSQWNLPGKNPEELERQFLRFMADRRVCPDKIHPDPIIRYDKGKVITDFTAYDKAATYYFDVLKMPHSYAPGFFHLVQWGFPPPNRFGEKPYEGDYPYEDVDRSKLRPEYKRAYQACLKAFYDHLKEKGWEKKVALYIGDEPSLHNPKIIEQGKALLQMIRETDPAIPVYCSTWQHVPGWDGYLNVWGIGHYGCVPPEKIKERRAAGDRVWFTTDGQMCTDTPYCGVERLLPHYCFQYDVEAYEFWGVNWLTYDPYEYGWHSYIHQSDTPGKSYYVRYPNGDGFLAYPGAPIGHDGPVSSVRLEQAREGCEDYEYLYLLRDLTAKARAAGKDTAAGRRRSRWRPAWCKSRTPAAATPPRSCRTRTASSW